MRALIRNESGVAMVTVMLTLMVITILSAAVAAGAMDSSNHSNHERWSSQALAAANAGVTAAAWRASHIVAGDTQCITNQAVSPSAGNCPGYTENSGNGGSYTYYVGPLLAQTDNCAGLFVKGPSGKTVSQRCVTALGTYHGVTRRVQTRVAGYPPTPFFPVNGILALNGFTGSGVLNVVGDIASNGTISVSGGSNSFSGNIYYVPPASSPSISTGCTSPTCVKTSKPQAFPAPATDPIAYANSVTTNNNAAVDWGKCGSTNVYNSATRVIAASCVPVLSNGVANSETNPIVLPSGIYNWCNLQFSNKIYIKLQDATTKVHIYMDSPYRLTPPTPGSGCPANTGNFSLSNQAWIVNPSGDPKSMLIDMYGDPTGVKSTVMKFTNNLNGSSQPVAMAVNAPNTDFSNTNVSWFNGGIVAKTFTGSNTFNFNATGIGKNPADATTPYYPSGWLECRPASGTSDPTANC